jgi:hypothetical protein
MCEAGIGLVVFAPVRVTLILDFTTGGAAGGCGEAVAGAGCACGGVGVGCGGAAAGTGDGRCTAGTLAIFFIMKDGMYTCASAFNADMLC